MKKRYRKKLASRIDYMGLTQKEVAKKINCHELTVSRIVRGKTKNIPLHIVYRLIKVLDCEASTILAGRDMRRYQEDIKKDLT